MSTNPGTDIVQRGGGTFELDQRRAKAYAESGYWKDASSLARALVKIEAGRALGLPAIVAMSEINVINEKPDIGSGALAALVKASGRYDYRVVELTDDRCVLRFYDRGEPIGESPFTMADAQRAGLDKRNPTYKTYPRNMLFVRAMSNGVAWFCPDVTMGRIYTSDELDADLGTPPPLPDEEDYADFGPAATAETQDDIEWPAPDPFEEPSDYEPAPDPD